MEISSQYLSDIQISDGFCFKSTLEDFCKIYKPDLKEDLSDIAFKCLCSKDTYFPCDFVDHCRVCKDVRAKIQLSRKRSDVFVYCAVCKKNYGAAYFRHHMNCHDGKYVHG